MTSLQAQRTGTKNRSTNESAVPVTEPRTFIHIRACPSFRIINPFLVVHDAFFATETSIESLSGLKSARGGSGRIGPLLTSRTRTQLPCFGALLAPQLRATNSPNDHHGCITQPRLSVTCLPMTEQWVVQQRNFNTERTVSVKIPFNVEV